MTADAVGGVWTYALDLARALGDSGMDIVLAVLGPSPSRAQRLELLPLRPVSVFEHGGRLEWMDDPWRDVAAASDWLLDLHRACAPDIVHLNGYCHGDLPWSCPVLMVGHSCVRSWWRAVKGTDAPTAWRTYSNEVARGLAAAGLVVSPSHAMLSALQQHYGPLARAAVIANGRSVRPLPVPKEPFVFTAGRLWDEAKNIGAVCRAAPALSWPVYVAGEGELPPSCRSVSPLGRLSTRQITAWMSRASIYALPARYEPFGLSALEAALAGCALVLGRIDSLQEIWGDAALYVDPDDQDQLRAALLRLIGDDRLRRRMGARARTRAQAFTPARMAAAYLDAYRHLARSREVADRSRARVRVVSPASAFVPAPIES